MIEFAALIIGVLTFAAGLWQARRASLANRPVVICHEVSNRNFDDRRGGWRCVVKVENASTQHAVNVRFGVELNGIRYPWRHAPEDEDGSRQNVLAPGQVTSELAVRFPSEFNFAGGGDPDPGRVYWCRYESISGDVWETRNPWERTGRFRIRRDRWGRMKRWRERRRRKKVMERGTRNLSEFRDSMLAEMKERRRTEQ